MPKQYVTNFYVFARVLLIIFISTIIKATEKTDFRKIAIMLLTMACLGFMSFAVSPTIVWAVIMLFATSMLYKTSVPVAEMLWSRLARQSGQSTEALTGYISTVDQIFRACKETILSVFLLFGESRACVALGIFYAVCVILFTLCTSRSPM